MYMGGMGDVWDDMAAADLEQGQAMRDLSMSDYAPHYLALPTAAAATDVPTASFNDWGQALTTAIKTWGQVSISQAQSDALKAQYTRPGLPSYYPPGVVPGLSPGYPFPGVGTILGISMGNWLLIGAAVIAVSMLSNGKRS